MNFLSRVQNLKKQLDELRPIAPEIERKIADKFRLDWNFHSNNLEGNHLTFGETKLLLLHGITASGKPLKDHFEITGHNEAIKLLEEVVKSQRPLTENFIRELHCLILKEPYEVEAISPDGKPAKKLIQIGSYKTSPNHVLTKTGEIFRFSEPFEVSAKMAELLKWLAKESEALELEPVSIAAIFHYKFILIHPFDDGNGRLARILMNFILMKFALPPVIIKTQDKENYLAALQKADGGMIEEFINYIAKNLISSLQIMVKAAKGEEIEEEEDLDKTIALLKSEFKNQKDIERLKNKESIAEIFTIVFDEFVKSCQKFDDFFDDSEFSVRIYGSESYSANLKTNQIDILARKILAKIEEKTHKIDLLHEHKFLKNNHHRELCRQSELKIEFDLKTYLVASASENSENFISKTYDQKLTSEEVKKLLKPLEEKHFDNIKKAISEVS